MEEDKIYKVKCLNKNPDLAIIVGNEYVVYSEWKGQWQISNENISVCWYDKKYFSEPFLSMVENPDIDLLDRFAMAALTGMMATRHIEDTPPEQIAGICYNQANAMLQERKKYLTIEQTETDTQND